jgi:hypothetical protein
LEKFAEAAGIAENGAGRDSGKVLLNLGRR